MDKPKFWFLKKISPICCQFQISVKHLQIDQLSHYVFFRRFDPNVITVCGRVNFWWEILLYLTILCSKKLEREENENGIEEKPVKTQENVE